MDMIFAEYDAGNLASGCRQTIDLWFLGCLRDVRVVARPVVSHQYNRGMHVGDQAQSRFQTFCHRAYNGHGTGSERHAVEMLDYAQLMRMLG